MSTDETMNERLGQLASTPTPSPDRAFVDNLDARLRVMHGEGAPAPGRNLRLPVLAAAAVLIIGLVGAVALRMQGETAVVMTVASDTSVYFEDGPVPGVPGLELPDGTRIVVGASGEAVVDGVVLAPGSEAIVENAQVALVVTGDDRGQPPAERTTLSVPADDERANPSSVPTSTEAEPPRSTSSVTSIDDRPGESTGTTTATRDTATDRSTPDGDNRSTSSPSTEPTRSTTTAELAATTTTAAPSRPSTTRTTIEATTTTTPATGSRITLTATDVSDVRVRLDWSIDGDLAPAGWRIWVGQGDRASTILVIRGGDARTATLERAVLVGRNLWIEAVDRSGATLELSEATTIG